MLKQNVEGGLVLRCYVDMAKTTDLQCEALANFVKFDLNIGRRNSIIIMNS